MKDVTIVPFNGKAPQIHESAFVAPGCRLIGDVMRPHDPCGDRPRGVSIEHEMAAGPCACGSTIQELTVGTSRHVGIEDRSLVAVEVEGCRRPRIDIDQADIVIGALNEIHPEATDDTQLPRDLGARGGIDGDQRGLSPGRRDGPQRAAVRREPGVSGTSACGEASASAPGAWSRRIGMATAACSATGSGQAA